jgi:hypothetical protein
MQRRATPMAILPHVPVRQWVLSLPHRLRYLLAWDHELCRAVLAVYARVLLAFHRRRARRRGLCDGHSGCVTVIQRFGGGLNLNVHFHTLVLDGAFTEGKDGALHFRPLPPPADEEVGAVLATIYVRVCRLQRRQGFDATAADLSRPDPIAEESPLLAGISSASIQGRIALGPRAGRRVWRVGVEPDAPWVLSTSPRHAHIAGFDLHANVAVPAAERARLEQLCRYLLRPPVAQDRLRHMGDDRILLTLKTPWADGTRHLIFAPMELLEKLAALTPRPRINLILYHGVLAPHARWRARVVAYGALPETTAIAPNLQGESGADAASPSQSRHWAWAYLMRRAFDIDVLACPRCGGRLRLLGTIEDPVAIRAILDHLAASAEGVDRAPPPSRWSPPPSRRSSDRPPAAAVCVAVCSKGATARHRASLRSAVGPLATPCDRLTGPSSALYVRGLYVRGPTMTPSASRTVAHR